MSPAQRAFSPCHPPLLVNSHLLFDSHSHSHARLSLEALVAFIAKQKALLLGDSAFRLSLQADCAPAPPDIGWVLFAHKGAVLALPLATPVTHSRAYSIASQTQPPSAPSPAPSCACPPARVRILDPVLAVYGEPDNPAELAALEHPKTLHAGGHGGKDECAADAVAQALGAVHTLAARPRRRRHPETNADPNADP
ncbi:hypothetical protein B0H17DRAFT_1193779 [Mycena rosella]|uniref:Uncharacterized protein n=1 Tax=Mycena rosella TaxID=1033263 RepID=A0AAD7M7A6_MYCRO|nr:hypothetical protein B0H17DRAFT_1193779 [Mycena rosella]